jgi:hypothetical protein
MRKITKTILRRKLDRLFSQIVRARGKCERCGRSRGIQLQTAHIFSRRLLGLRWDLNNAFVFCAACHFWAHANPLLFGEFVLNFRGKEEYEILKEKSSTIYKPTLSDLQTKLEVLEKMAKKGE